VEELIQRTNRDLYQQAVDDVLLGGARMHLHHMEPTGDVEAHQGQSWQITRCRDCGTQGRRRA
jgi:hypothetical protein